MSASRAAVMVIGVNLVAVWVAAAAGGGAAQPPRQPELQARQDRSVVEAQSALIEATDRLRRYAGPSPEAAQVRRDPFNFGGDRAPRPETIALEPANATPVATAAPAAPDIVLQGMAESRDGETVVRTAMLGVGGELVFASVGSTVGGRFTVVALTAESVELEAIAGGGRQTIHFR